MIGAVISGEVSRDAKRDSALGTVANDKTTADAGTSSIYRLQSK